MVGVGGRNSFAQQYCLIVAQQLRHERPLRCILVYLFRQACTNDIEVGVATVKDGGIGVYNNREVLYRLLCYRRFFQMATNFLISVDDVFKLIGILNLVKREGDTICHCGKKVQLLAGEGRWCTPCQDERPTQFPAALHRDPCGRLYSQYLG